jgi:HlyD family secretion protein
VTVRRLRRLFVQLVAGLLTAGFLAYSFWPRPIEVDVAQASRGSLRVTVDEDGKTRIKERYVVSAPLAGQLQRISLRAGDPVVAGKTMLAVIEPGDPALLDDRSRAQAEARVKAAEATRKQAVSRLDRARVAFNLSLKELQRYRQMMVGRETTYQDLENAEHKERMAQEDMKTAQFAIQIADFELDLARAALLRTRPRSPGDADTWRFEIHAPVSGRVLRVFQESSAIVTPGQQLLEVGDPSDLEIEIDVLSSDAVKIAPGAKVILEHWGGDAPLLGQVRVVEPSGFMKRSALGVEEQRVNVIIDFVDPPEKRRRLGDAYRVEARIVIWSAENVLKVPSGCLFRHGDDWAVYAISEGRAELRRLAVGRSNALETEITSGLEEGAVVILHPGDKIQPGIRVVSR